MKINLFNKITLHFHKFNKNTPWQWSRLERVHFNYWEISLGKIWLGIEKTIDGVSIS